MRTTSIGRQAEAAVADYLSRHGWKILAKNWKTPVCEIDIVVKRKSVIYFVEVKFRSSDSQGQGLNYITNRKLNQLHFAARIWNQHNHWEGDYRLLAAAVTGSGKHPKIEIVELE